MSLLCEADSSKGGFSGIDYQLYIHFVVYGLEVYCKLDSNRPFGLYDLKLNFGTMPLAFPRLHFQDSVNF